MENVLLNLTCHYRNRTQPLRAKIGKIASGVPDRGLEDSNVLLDSAAAYADAGNYLAPARERRSASHRTVPALRHQWEQRLARLHQRKKVGRAQPHERGRIGLSLGQLDREGWRSAHPMLQDSVAVNVDHANGN